jgi:putative nucleotidyltransferase with HDIG domain
MGAMPGSLKLYIAGVAIVCAVALAVATLAFPARSEIAVGPGPLGIMLGVAFFIGLTVFASAIPVHMPHGLMISVSLAPIIVAMNLGGPAVAGWVALLGSTEMREIRGRIPWYGTLSNHVGLALPAVVGGIALDLIRGPSGDPALDFVATMVGGLVCYALNICLASVVLGLRTRQPVSHVLMDSRAVATGETALVPLAWLMAKVFVLVGWWAALLFALPLYTTRLAYGRYVAMREMFTQTIGALAEAVDKRDPFTSKHSQRVKQIAVDIGREMRVSEAELEALEWGGLLHDVGKIGVPDAVLLKQERLTREERMIMNAHPVLGAQIIAPVTRLAPELPIIRHHHEWYNGSGYPDRLIGDEIPRLARILHVADAFEAMTAARPYRMTPLTAEQALAELRKFAGIQFDPAVVDAFVRTDWVDGVQDPGRRIEPRPIPLIAQAASRMTEAHAAQPDA